MNCLICSCSIPSYETHNGCCFKCLGKEHERLQEDIRQIAVARRLSAATIEKIWKPLCRDQADVAIAAQRSLAEELESLLLTCKCKSSLNIPSLPPSAPS